MEEPLPSSALIVGNSIPLSLSKAKQSASLSYLETLITNTSELLQPYFVYASTI